MTTSRRLVPKLILAACVLACAAPLMQSVAQAAPWGFGSERVQGSGKIVRQQRDIGHFTGVSNGLAANVEIRIGNTESVTVETDDNLQPLVDTVVEDGMLKIQTTRRNLNLQTRSMKIIVQAKAIDHISLGGSGTIDSDAVRARKVQLDLGGSGNIKLKGIEADTLSVSLGGSGDLKAAGGSAKNVSISIGGSGDVNLGPVQSSSVSVTIAGSGEATVWAKDALSLTVAGSGDVNYYGDPRVSKTVVGSGSAHRLGAAPQ
jgi:hypothetical protein